jgi:hypothetical protein
MITFKWILLISIVFLSLLGGYYQLLLIGMTKEGRRKGVWFGSWLFDSTSLNDDGLVVRKKLMRLMFIGAVLLVIYFLL